MPTFQGKKIINLKMEVVGGTKKGAARLKLLMIDEDTKRDIQEGLESWLLANGL